MFSKWEKTFRINTIHFKMIHWTINGNVRENSRNTKSEKNYMQMDFMLFACVLKVFFWQLIDKLKQTKLYQELKIVLNFEKFDLSS